MTIIDDYLDLQKKYVEEYGENTCVLMQVGHFYEVYAIDNFEEKSNNENIYRMADFLNIQLTRKNKNIVVNSRGNPLMVGINLFSLDKYVQLLMNNNYTVVLVEQVSPPPEPDRKVTSIYSPGTTINYITKGDTSHLMVIYIENVKNMKTMKNNINIGISVVDLSIGKTVVYETYSKKDDQKYSLDETFRFIQLYDPKEIVIYTNSSDITETELVSYLELNNRVVHFKKDADKQFTNLNYQKSFLEKVYPERGLLSVIEYINMEFHTYSLISFVIALEFAYKHNEEIIKKLEKPEICNNNSHFVLTNNSLQQLNIFNNSTQTKTNFNKFNSLFGVINQTSTPVGRRLLRDYISHPLTDTKILEKRYTLTEGFIENDFYKNIEESLRRISDIERFHRKVGLNMVQPADFVGLDISYENIITIIDACKGSSNPSINELLPDSSILTNFYDMIAYYRKIFDMGEIAKYHIDKIDNSFFNKNNFSEIDSIQEEIDLSITQFKTISKKLSDLIDNGSGFVHFDSNEKEGYFLYITNKRSKLLKNRFVNTKYSKIQCGGGIELCPKKIEFKKLNQTNVKIMSEDLDMLSDRIRKNRLKIGTVVRNRYTETLDYIDKHFIKGLKRIASFVAVCDVVKSSAKTACLYGYTRPVIKKNSSSFIDAKDIRHPIIERIQTDIDYVTNDITVGQTENKGILLFGTNASGKSSLMKAIGINIIMAQAGMFVPCSSFVFCPYKYLFTRINNNDNLFRGESSFAVEMNELRSIHKRSGPESLVLGDELCSGTESVSALSIFASSVDHLVKKNTSFIFATHLHELCQLDEIKALHNSIKLYHLKVLYDKEKDRLVYNRKLEPGNGNAIYGLEVCKSMDMDSEFLEKANSIRKKIMGIDTTVLENKQSKYNTQLFIDRCMVCNEKAEDVHHIKFQCTADINKMIGHIQKDTRSNLVALCKPCHIKVHNDNLTINGYIQTDHGLELDYEYIDKKTNEENKRNRKKFNKQQVSEIKTFILGLGKISQKTMCYKIMSEKNMKVSPSILKKIIENNY